MTLKEFHNLMNKWQIARMYAVYSKCFFNNLPNFHKKPKAFTKVQQSESTIKESVFGQFLKLKPALSRLYYSHVEISFLSHAKCGKPFLFVGPASPQLPAVLFKLPLVLIPRLFQRLKWILGPVLSFIRLFLFKSDEHLPF